MRIEYHRTLIADRVREEAFAAALAKLVAPGVTRVADLGAGTGVLGLMAAKAGAASVVMLEAAEVAAVAVEVAAASGLGACALVPAHSTEYLEPERADLVISETLGNYAFEEGIALTMADAKARYLARGGKLCPSAIRQYVCPVIAPRLDAELRVWEEAGGRLGLDFGPALRLTLNNAYVRTLGPSELLGGGAQARLWDACELGTDGAAGRAGEAAWSLSEPARVYGLALWWEADLAPDVTLSTSPLAAPTHWEQLYLPALAPIALSQDEGLRARIASRFGFEEGTRLAWTVQHLSPGGEVLEEQSLDLEAGWLP